MYERSAIVLERFFENLLGFNQVNNLKKNFDNYCELFEKFKVLQTANSDEIKALKQFQDAEEKIEDIQAQEEKLYKKSAKLQYNRDLMFQDISQKPDEIEKCSLKIESDIQKNHNKLIELREEFVNAVKNYNEKKSVLSKCKKTRKKAEADYNTIFDETKLNLENIPEEYIVIAKEFSISEVQADVIEALADNGKSEKIPFNNQVITNAAQTGFDIKTKEVESYLEAYKLSQKLINELLDGAVSMELHEKKIRNMLVKFNFLEAEKDYIVGFLDYERITVIYGKRMHRTLMIDACEKLEKDIEQVENLYKILLKEIAGKSTKKAYKDLYNKSYLLEIEENRVNLSTGTIMNSNYWRIEGIKNIYTVFYKNVVEVFGKDLDEFEIPQEDEENFDDESIIPEIQENTDAVEVKEEIKAEKIEDSSKQLKEITSESDGKDAFGDNKIFSMVEELFDEIDIMDNKLINSKKVDVEEKAIEVKEEDIIENTQKKLKLAKIVKKRGRKKLKHYTRQISKIEENIQEDEKKDDIENVLIAEELEEKVIEPETINNNADDDNTYEEHDIFGEKYQNIDSQIAELEDLEEYKMSKAQAKEDLEEIEEESIFESMEEDKENIDLVEIDLEQDFKKKKSKNKIFSGLKKLNSKSKKKLANE